MVRKADSSFSEDLGDVGLEFIFLFNVIQRFFSENNLAVCVKTLKIWFNFSRLNNKHFLIN